MPHFCSVRELRFRVTTSTTLSLRHQIRDAFHRNASVVESSVESIGLTEPDHASLRWCATRNKYLPDLLEADHEETTLLPRLYRFALETTFGVTSVAQSLMKLKM